MAVVELVIGILGLFFALGFGIWGVRQSSRREKAVREVHGALTFAEGLLHGLKAGASATQIPQLDNGIARIGEKAKAISSI